jgi:hypothetical protein
MKYKINYLGIVILFSLFIGGCTPDFIEKDISKQSIQLMAPANGLQTTTATQTFWWTQLSGAENYELEIVKGTFSYVQQLILDTTITYNKFNYTLFPGSYQWRVRGMNAGTNTPFTTFSLTVDTTSNMSAQIVVLVSPANNFYSNQLLNTFKWDSIHGASNYEIQIINQSTSNIVVDTAVKIATYTRSLGDGTYTWQVRAQNITSNSPYTSRTITIDTTHPTTPVLLAPVDSSTTASTHFTLSWTNGILKGSPVSDSLYIYYNSALTIVLKDTLTSLTSYSDTLVAGTYYWRVRSIDAAGNKSGYSATFKFTTP